MLNKNNYYLSIKIQIDRLTLLPLVRVILNIFKSFLKFIKFLRKSKSPSFSRVAYAMRTNHITDIYSIQKAAQVLRKNTPIQKKYCKFSSIFKDFCVFPLTLLVWPSFIENLL